ncbi:MAG: hypothetical protein VX278_07655 [Myxococcota bacterium]|nr:hypothetical protein [Myxococcota bacterium]
MIVFAFLMACAEKETTGSELEDVPENTTPTDFERSLRCRLTELSVDQEWDGGGEAYTTYYTWDGNVQSFDTGRYTYNDYGYVTESYLFQEGWEQTTNYTYNCDSWCKTLSIVSDDGAIDLEYTWDGNTQYQENSRYWEYNDYGYMTYMFDEGAGWENSASYEYDCDGTWCRLMSYTAVQVIEGERENTSIEYLWEGNRQSWDQGYYEYNDFGYPIEYFEENEYSRNWYRYTYDCE